MNKAAKFYYDTMIRSYCKMQENDRSAIEYYDAFLAAAKALAQLGLPNPFDEHNNTALSLNAAKRPSKESTVVTAVVE